MEIVVVIHFHARYGYEPTSVGILVASWLLLPSMVVFPGKEHRCNQKTPIPEYCKMTGQI